MLLRVCVVRHSPVLGTTFVPMGTPSGAMISSSQVAFQGVVPGAAAPQFPGQQPYPAPYPQANYAYPPQEQQPGQAQNSAQTWQ